MAQYKGAASEAGRALQLMKKREKQREHMEQMRQRIAEENIMKSNIDKKFSAHYDAVEAELKSSTVGLVTLNDMKAKQEALVKEREKQLAKKEQSKELQLKLERQRERERKQEQKRKISSLSFTLDEEEEEEEEEEDDDEDEEEGIDQEEEEPEPEESPPKKRKLGKNPDVDTSFLPDRDREEEENRLREELRQEWEAKQEKIKTVWGGGHSSLTACLPPFSQMKKGNTIQQFLQKALEILRKDFSELRSAGVEQLMYIKEDLIIPNHHSFYDFIVTKARGKSGKLPPSPQLHSTPHRISTGSWGSVGCGCIICGSRSWAVQWEGGCCAPRWEGAAGDSRGGGCFSRKCRSHTLPPPRATVQF
uniref:Family with sequence similarity 50 member B n=1 Tax=Sphenodon punctatus TaxID=8508 RepID=A0A8D0L7W6_SPHPU